MIQRDLLTTGDHSCIVCGTGSGSGWTVRIGHNFRRRQIGHVQIFLGKVSQTEYNGRIHYGTYQQELGQR